MDKEGHDQTNVPVFESKDIGSQPTTQFFPGADKEKLKQHKQEKRTNKNRKKLGIALSIVAAIALVTIIVVAVVTNIPKKGRFDWTHEDFPENLDEFKEKTFSLVFSDGYNFAGAAEFVYFAVDDTEDEERKFALQVFHAEVMSYGGYFDSAKTELERLEAVASTNERKYILYNTMVGVYYRSGDTALAADYYEKLNALDVPENQAEYIGDDDANSANSAAETVKQAEEAIKNAEEKSNEQAN